MREALRVYVTGGSGYIGQRLIAALLQTGCEVTALVRPGSAAKVPPQCRIVLGSALKAADYRGLTSEHTLVHLVGTPHPAPWKAAQFRDVDQASFDAALAAAVQAQVRHFVYLSVAHPAPVMQSYTTIRAACEARLRDSGLRATVVRPWYVLGPGHRWPYALLPAYWLCERIPGLRDGAQRLGLVTLGQLVRALTACVLSPASIHRIWDVPAIRRGEIPKELVQTVR